MAENLPDTNVGNIEYIRKQDMLNVIEKLDIIPSVDGMGIPTSAEDFRVQFLGTVLKVEPADVVQVVRCKNCKFYTSMRPDIKTGICDLNVHHMGDDGFCSCGERKE